MTPDQPDAAAPGVEVPPQRKDGTFTGCLGCLGFILILLSIVVAYYALFPVALHVLSDAYVSLARSATAGNPRGMAVAGWLLFVITAFSILALTLTRHRLSRPWARTIVAVSAILAITAWNLLPLRGSGLVETVDGPGGSGFITGVRWGAPAAGLLLMIAAHVQFRKRAKDFYVRHSLLRWTIGLASALSYEIRVLHGG
ncbi:hypothetical protein FHR83_006875 [Actinoplanes campanulatus]|uniref:Uncharacterized protein n=1 Tax=Actinoplanes campanulatus TaxID=113559 RepID=A0A7W5ANM5_9ACTN|nr:hypothetical protein [Actinoplanes campanulatus]MBB3099169.1 hypothetical protein [Actinoplanes campanulatus]GGN38696.1 hypothetical protein GCM10010109_65830 [Actinoplanes campanulatus]GID40326.1 hypothetical protein Aca09nite_68320 [Actinoplanes campanulatus]